MNNLFFTALCLALLYYFFFYLPSLKKISQPTFTNQATQTMKEVADKEVQTSLAVENKETQTDNKEIKELKKQLDKLLTILGIDGSTFSIEEAALLIKRWKDKEMDWYTKQIETIKEMVIRSTNLSDLHKKIYGSRIEFGSQKDYDLKNNKNKE